MGLPSIILFNISEQESWAIQSKKHGVSRGFFPVSKFTPKALSKLIIECINNPQYKSAAQLISNKMINENGVLTLVNLIKGTSKNLKFQRVFRIE